MKKKELPNGWINRKRYNAMFWGSWVVLFGGFALLVIYDQFISSLGSLTIVIWAIVIFVINMIFKNSLVNKEKMETNKPMIELIRNIEGNEALVAVNDLLSREDLSLAMKEKFLIEKVYTLMYLGKTIEAQELLAQIERPSNGHNLYVYLELKFELAKNPKEALNDEILRIEEVSDVQTKNTLQGILDYHKSIIEAEETGNPSKELRDMIYTQKDIFTMLMNQYRIIKIYKNRSRFLVREACEKCLEYGNDLHRFTDLAKTTLEELGPVTKEEELEAEKAREMGSSFLDYVEGSQEDEALENVFDKNEENVQDLNEDNNQ